MDEHKQVPGKDKHFKSGFKGTKPFFKTLFFLCAILVLATVSFATTSFMVKRYLTTEKQEKEEPNKTVKSENKPPKCEKIEADVTQGDMPLKVELTSVASDEDGEIKTYIWDFGDGTITEGQSSIEHTYTSAGNFNVYLSVKDNKSAESPERCNILLTVRQPVSETPPPADAEKPASPQPTTPTQSCDVWEFEESFYCLTEDQYDEFISLKVDLHNITNALLSDATTVDRAYFYTVCENPSKDNPFNTTCPSVYPEEDRKKGEDAEGFVDYAMEKIIPLTNDFLDLMEATEVTDGSSSKGLIPDLRRYGNDSNYKKIEFISGEEFPEYLKK